MLQRRLDWDPVHRLHMPCTHAGASWDAETGSARYGAGRRGATCAAKRRAPCGGRYAAVPWGYALPGMIKIVSYTAEPRCVSKRARRPCAWRAARRRADGFFFRWSWGKLHAAHEQASVAPLLNAPLERAAASSTPRKGAARLGTQVSWLRKISVRQHDQDY